MADNYLRAIQRKDRSNVQDFVQSGGQAFYWCTDKEKSSIHQFCQYFDKDVFDYLWNKLKTEEGLHQKWHKGNASGSLPQHLLAKNKTDEMTKMQVKTAFEKLVNHDWGEGQSLDIESKDGKGCTVLDYAEAAQNESLVKFLKQKLFHEVQLPSLSGEIPSTFENFWEAIERGNVKDCQEILKPEYLNRENPANGRTCLQQAVILQNHSVVDFLLKQDGINPNQTTEKEPYPPVFLACKNIDKDCLNQLRNHPQLDDWYETKIEGDNIMHVLLSKNVKFTKNRHWTFEHIKIMHTILSIIIEMNPEKAAKLINQADEKEHRTPLHYATLLPGQSIVKLLLNNGGEKSLFKKDKGKIKKCGSSEERQGPEIPINLMDTETVRELLDDKMTWSGPFYHDHFEVNFDLDFLVPKIRRPIEEGQDEAQQHLEDSGYPIHEKEVFEFENLAMMKKDQMDLFDHPIIASMIM